ncbi:3-oxoacyl-ACP reductase FabG [Acidihalobacter ferrooxydans]|uniref:3-oxoacyl-ACP reductase n=1 Tax=Acidihalobacter ferrooxydans TaxID=1765967 RepID=A0A1P8UE65_9GAMM|nr:3-oxoacyl-ACP reductase FabG [Acidihalobacter ferrooxydans]APZ42096.1 3-oxoacyl-ACP reductase [Acidihalobacter ferrooxydans]
MINSRTVLVTGATLGIGKGIANVFAKNGYNVVLSARNAAHGAQAEQDIKAASGNEKVLFVAGDVTRFESMRQVVATAVATFGGLDVLCANAGMFPSAKLDAMTEQEWDDIFAVNVKGMLFSVQAALDALRQSPAGRVVITSSITGPVTGFPGWAHYGSTKAAQLGFMRTAAIELARDGITVNAVLPGNIYTEGLQGMGDAYLDSMKASIPMKRLGDVEDIGYAALFFAQETSGYVTGQSLIVDGGQILPETLEAVDA